MPPHLLPITSALLARSSVRLSQRMCGRASRTQSRTRSRASPPQNTYEEASTQVSRRERANRGRGECEDFGGRARRQDGLPAWDLCYKDADFRFHMTPIQSRCPYQLGAYACAGRRHQRPSTPRKPIPQAPRSPSFRPGKKATGLPLPVTGDTRSVNPALVRGCAQRCRMPCRCPPHPQLPSAAVLQSVSVEQTQTTVSLPVPGTHAHKDVTAQIHASALTHAYSASTHPPTHTHAHAHPPTHTRGHG